MARRAAWTLPRPIRTFSPSLRPRRVACLQLDILMSKYVYFFGSGKAEGRADMKELLGGKGANLAEMTNIGLPVPAGFTLTTEVCTYFYAHGRKYPPELKEQVLEALRKVEASLGTKFGDSPNP